MNDKKQIEAMAKDLNQYISYDEWSAREYGEYDVDCDYTAFKLVEQGWVKIDKDKEVVISREEYNEIKQYQSYIPELKKAFDKIRKETAKEILDEIGSIQIDKSMSTPTLMFIYKKLKELAKQYGVEEQQ